MTRSAFVYMHEKLAGKITEDAEGNYIFLYNSDYLKSKETSPISLTIPKREEPFSSQTLFPFFDGLIPEGWLLNLTIKNWKINQKDRMGLLLEACSDCIGAVSIRKTEAN